VTARRSRAHLVTDVGLAVLFLLVCLPFALLGDLFDLAALLLFSGALAVRRLVPAWSLGLAWAGALLQMVGLRDLQLYDTAVLGVLYATAAYGGRRVKWVGLASAVLGAIVATVYLVFVPPASGMGPLAAASPEPYGWALWFGFLLTASLAVLVLAWTAGLLVRAVRDSREIRRREEVATRERELVEYRYVVEQERNRIARDMHDVVAHSLAVVIAQADGARFAAASNPAVAVDALGTIAGVARGALGDVRLLLAELRHADGSAPQPVLDDLDELLDQLRVAGLEISFTESGERVTLGTGHQIAVYRIVQEGLTNALRHGDGSAKVFLSLSWSARGVRIEIVNGLRAGAERGAAGHRHGIPGMRERAQLTGGTLHTEIDDARFRLVAEIPGPGHGAGTPAHTERTP